MADTPSNGGIAIVGAGLAGLFTALKLAPRPVTVIAPAPLGQGASSAWAQGGIAAAVGEGDSPEQHAADTIRAGAGLVDAEVAHMVAREAASRVHDLLTYGVPFDRDLAGHFVLSREAAHSQKRIVRVAGDRAGQAIMAALVAAVRRTPSIRVLEGFAAEYLVIRNGRVTGAALAHTGDPAAPLMRLEAGAVVLATGGIGGLYSVTTNPPDARGEALGMAARAGAAIADAEFVQFHPTAMDVGLDPAPLATEALRGDGAVLINDKGQRFMLSRHPDAELAPRDVVARGVFREIADGRRAFLDCRAAIGARFPDAYPTVYASCRSAGVDPVTEPIPVAPAEHYHMGGVATDISGRTTLPGLWSVGEAASTGLHGANRLASNSLLEAVVFGARAAEDMAAVVGPCAIVPVRGARRSVDLAARAVLTAEIRQTMSRFVGVERDAAGLAAALSVFGRIRRTPPNDPVIANMALAAHIIAAAALRRTESRGSHFRRDFPQSDAGQARRSIQRSLP